MLVRAFHGATGSWQPFALCGVLPWGDTIKQVVWFTVIIDDPVSTEH
jgi:hypothetical protein